VRVGERGLKVACEIRDFIFENVVLPLTELLARW